MKTRVLVVDDDRLVADTLCLIYQRNGFDTEARYSAHEAFECAKIFEPNLVLCDVTLPQESGLELADRVQAALPGTRMLLLSGYASNAHLVFAHSQRTQRPFTLLSKPCRPEDLLRESQALLKSA